MADEYDSLNERWGSGYNGAGRRQTPSSIRRNRKPWGTWSQDPRETTIGDLDRALSEYGGTTGVQDYARSRADENAQLATVVLLRRRSENSAAAYRLDLRPVVEGKSLAADVILQPDDVVYVPQTFIADMEQFIQQVFGGLLPIPTLFRETYEAIYIRDLAIFRRPVVIGQE